MLLIGGRVNYVVVGGKRINFCVRCNHESGSRIICRHCCKR